MLAIPLAKIQVTDELAEANLLKALQGMVASLRERGQAAEESGRVPEETIFHLKISMRFGLWSRGPMVG